MPATTGEAGVTPSCVVVKIVWDAETISIPTGAVPTVMGMPGVFDGHINGRANHCVVTGVGDVGGRAICSDRDLARLCADGDGSAG